MKKIICLLIISIVFLSGCPTVPEPTELPDDFDLTYSSGATHIDWGWYELKVGVDGKAVFTKGAGMAMKKSYSFEATEEELLEIYKSAVKNNFFSLLEEYQDPFVMDGGWSEIEIRADGSSKKVSVINFSQEQFDEIKSKIASLIIAKLGEDAFSLAFFEYCDEMKTECSSLTGECLDDIECELKTYECEEWAYYCSWDAVTDLTSEYCDVLENREECIDFCINEQCSDELCDALLFEAPGCTECSPGCCEMCTNLDLCYNTLGCQTQWIHPSGESWQFGGCANMNLCADLAELCNYLGFSYQGFAYEAYIEENPEKAEVYNTLSINLESIYSSECN